MLEGNFQQLMLISQMISRVMTEILQETLLQKIHKKKGRTTLSIFNFWMIATAVLVKP